MRRVLQQVDAHGELERGDWLPLRGEVMADIDKMKAALPSAEHIWYLGVSHGFAVRGPPSADAMREKCAADVTSFLKTALA